MRPSGFELRNTHNNYAESPMNPMALYSIKNLSTHKLKQDLGFFEKRKKRETNQNTTRQITASMIS